MHERRLVLAVAEAAGQDRLHRIRLERVDAELQSDVARARDHEVVDRADPRQLVAHRDSLHRFLRRGADVVGHAELVLDQTPVEPPDVVPGPVGGDVDVSEHLAVARHRRLRHELGDVLCRPPPPGAAVRQLAFLVHETLQRRGAGVEGAPGRAEEHVVGHAPRLRPLQVGEVAEIVGEEVRRRIVGARHQLENVSGLELREGDDAGAQVVVQPVPGLGEVAFPFRLAFEDGAVLLEDAGALDLHHLLVGGILHALGARGIDPACRVRPQHQLPRARGKPVRKHLHHREVRQHLDVLAGDRGELRQVLRVVQVWSCVPLLGPDGPDQLAQGRILRAQRERAGERGERAGIILRPQPVASELLVRLGIVRRERECLRVRLLRRVDAPVFREQPGGAEPRVQGRWLDGERLTEVLQRAVQVAAVER